MIFRQLVDLRSSTAALMAGLDDEKWSDAHVREASLLPKWTRGHVLTHIARNADGISQTIAGALRGEIVKRYPGGSEQRDRDIEDGAQRSVLDQFVDVRDSAERLDRVLAAVAAQDAWEIHCDDRTAAQYLLARWREVEVHRVDLAGRYAPVDWPPAFVSYIVPELVRQVDERADGELRIRVDPLGSITTDLPGSSWTAGTGRPIDVIGPDWAIAVWLVGRPALARDALSATPNLRPWM